MQDWNWIFQRCFSVNECWNLFKENLFLDAINRITPIIVKSKAGVQHMARGSESGPP